MRPGVRRLCEFDCFRRDAGNNSNAPSGAIGWGGGRGRPGGHNDREAGRVRGDANRSSLSRILDFLASIGLPCQSADLPGDTFMPGIRIEHGRLLYDPLRTLYPGDLLHEAGHLAVMSPRRRAAAHVSVGKRAAEEMMAIAWSYAATLAAGIDPAVVFHEHGYRGGGPSLLENFTAGRTIGVPMLQWLGMTAEPHKAADLGLPEFPHMTKWLNDRDDPAPEARP